MFINYALIIFLILGLINLYVFELNIFQQSGYKVFKYLKTFKRYYYKDLSSYLRIIVLILSILYLYYKNFILTVLIMFIILGIVLLNKKTILKLKLTKRMNRLIVVIVTFQLLMLFNPILLLTIEMIILPFIILLCNLILAPLEYLIRRKYIKIAKEKLDYINPIKIGITGSYGKTTTKHFIYEFLKDNYQTTLSPKSYNTEMGLCKSIIENLNYLDEIYIAELGATSPCDIEKLTKLVNVDIGIITDIGIQHIETFKTIENILKTKLEILKSNNIKTLIINNDNEYLSSYLYPQDINIIKVGTNSNSDIRIDNIKLGFEYNEFDIVLDKPYHVKTSIVGKHNIINITLAVTAAFYLGEDIQQLIEKTKQLKPVNNRLEIKKIENHLVIDNSFNSNFNGFINNIDLLNLSNRFKIVITPGLVELQNKGFEIHKEIANYLIKKVDFVYLISNTNTIYMKEEFLKNGFYNFIMLDTFNEAYKLALSTKQQSTILIENDLTDYYLNGGL